MKQYHMADLQDGPPPQATILHDYQDDFEWLRVCETQDPHLKLLYFEDSLHGAIDCDTPGKPVLSYVALYLGYLRRRGAAPKTMLMGGLGGCGFWHAAAAIWPELDKTCIEINPRVIECAKQHFFLEPNARVLEDDLRRCLAEESLPAFDILLCDCYGAIDLPPHLMTREFMQLIHTALAPGGFAAFNLADAEANAVLGHQLRTILTVFGRIALLRDPEAANVAAIVCKDPQQIVSEAVHWQQTLYLSEILDADAEETLPTAVRNAVVLTDENLADTLDQFGLCC
ncbi:fused MFS/spermidine synthase [Acanthopleuribacter pedis]|uniref:Fused MFS/spermidine synthase n=1 Tax=Acanthopleuribacter pedis TaxID=442870 RepID=A0A8J7QMU0_9BACT|nr:fused MFS/spermidine synthase [Acanthopleuribacter pedis]MBO1321293.1 fused MFS/spermidine synthase [Acanthopleuribacter pedis]